MWNLLSNHTHYMRRDVEDRFSAWGTNTYIPFIFHLLRWQDNDMVVRRSSQNAFDHLTPLVQSFNIHSVVWAKQAAKDWGYSQKCAVPVTAVLLQNCSFIRRNTVTFFLHIHPAYLVAGVEMVGTFASCIKWFAMEIVENTLPGKSPVCLNTLDSWYCLFT